MKTWLNVKLSNVIKQWSSDYTVGKPQLCTEINNISKQEIVRIVQSLLNSWNVNILLVMTFRGSESITCAITSDEVVPIIEKNIEAQSTWSAIDLKLVGGCTIDVTKTNESYELLMATWGDREKCLIELAEREKNIELFRGN